MKKLYFVIKSEHSLMATPVIVFENIDDAINEYKKLWNDHYLCAIEMDSDFGLTQYIILDDEIILGSDEEKIKEYIKEIEMFCQKELKTNDLST